MTAAREGTIAGSGVGAVFARCRAQGRGALVGYLPAGLTPGRSSPASCGCSTFWRERDTARI